MVLTKNALFSCGVPFYENPDELNVSIAGEKGGILLSLDKNDGKELSKITLSSAPMWDGMAAAQDALFA